MTLSYSESHPSRAFLGSPYRLHRAVVVLRGLRKKVFCITLILQLNAGPSANPHGLYL